MKIIENLPVPILKPIATVASHFPRQILSLRYYLWTRQRLNWKSPSTLQEFVLKNLIDSAADPARLNLFALMADKVRVREFVKKKAPTLRCPQLYGRWENVEQINWDSLPSSYVLKTNNGCGTNLIVPDHEQLDKTDALKRLKRWLAFPYGELSGQIHYSHIKPLILAEEFLRPADGSALPPDYKLFCINGKPKFFLYYEDRKVNGHITPNMAYDLNWKAMNVVRRPITHEVPTPVSLKKMIEHATALCEGLRFARIDFYEIDGEPVFGEITLTPDVVTNFIPEFLQQVMNRIKQ